MRWLTAGIVIIALIIALSRKALTELFMDPGREAVSDPAVVFREIKDLIPCEKRSHTAFAADAIVNPGTISVEP